MNKIAFLNDRQRRTFARGKVLMSPGVSELSEEKLTQVLERVRHFDEFTQTTIRMAIMISAVSRSPASRTFQDRLLLMGYAGRLRRPWRFRKDSARAHPSCARMSTDPQLSGVFSCEP